MQKRIKVCMVRKYTLNTSPTCTNTGNDIYTPEQYVLVHHIQCTPVTMYIQWDTVRKLLIFRSTQKGMCDSEVYDS